MVKSRFGCQALILSEPALNTPALVHRISVNGEARECPAGALLADLLRDLDLAGRKIAVERNGEIVPRSLHAQTLLRDGDRLEIVVAVGGG